MKDTITLDAPITVEGLKNGMTFTLAVPPMDLWSRVRRFFGFRVPLVEREFVITSVTGPSVGDFGRDL